MHKDRDPIPQDLEIEIDEATLDRFNHRIGQIRADFDGKPKDVELENGRLITSVAKEIYQDGLGQSKDHGDDIVTFMSTLSELLENKNPIVITPKEVPVRGTSEQEVRYHFTIGYHQQLRELAEREANIVLETLLPQEFRAKPMDVPVGVLKKNEGIRSRIKGTFEAGGKVKLKFKQTTPQG